MVKDERGCRATRLSGDHRAVLPARRAAAVCRRRLNNDPVSSRTRARPTANPHHLAISRMGGWAAHLFGAIPRRGGLARCRTIRERRIA